MEPKIFAVIRIGDNAIAREGGDQFRLHEKNALNGPIDAVVDLIVEVINQKLEKFYPEPSISADAPRILDAQTGVAERKIQIQSPEPLPPELLEEILGVVRMLVAGLIPGAGRLFSGTADPDLAPDRVEFVSEQISKLIERQNGKKITKPATLVLHFPNEKTLEIPIQGAFAPPPYLPDESGKPVEILAKPDGVRASNMQIFLRLIDEAGCALKGSSVICLANQSSQIQLAAGAFLDDNLLLKASVVEITANKRKKQASIQHQRSESSTTGRAVQRG